MNVQTLGENVLGRARLHLLDAFAGRIDVPPARVGEPQWRVLSCWGIDWSGPNAFTQLLEAPGQPAREFARPPRSWALLAPGVRFGERFRAPEPRREYLFASFTAGGPLPPLSGRPYTLALDPDDRLPPLFRALHERIRRGSLGAAVAASGLLAQILGEIIAAARADAVGDERAPWRLASDVGDRPASLLDRVDALLLRSLAAPPSRNAIAEGLGMSESTLAHRFRAETGMGLRERARWLRVREAKTRLAEAGASAKAVALALGFGDQAYFTRVFRELTGMTPQEFQRRAAP